MLGYLLQAVYVVVWIALLVHCVHRRAFYPLFGHNRATKTVWLASFILFNPLVNLGYTVFGVLLRPPTAERPARRLLLTRLVAAVYLLAAVFLYNVPRSVAPTEPRVVTQGDMREGGSSESSMFSFGAHAGTIEANNQSSMTASTSHSNNARLAVRDVAIMCADSHRMIEAVAAEVQEGLAQLPSIERVTWYPLGDGPARGTRLPAATLTLTLPRISETPLPLGRKVDALIGWELSKAPCQGRSHTFTSYSPPVISFDIKGQIVHASTSHGIELGNAKYKQVADNIAGEVAKSIGKQFERVLEEHGAMPDLPEAVQGVYTETPDFPFIRKDEAEELVSGSGLLMHNTTAWRFPEPREDTEALSAYREALKADGWNGSEPDADLAHLRMERGAESIGIYRQLPRDERTGAELYNAPEQHPEMPMCARYERAFTMDELKAAMETLLDEETPVDTLIIFKRFFRGDELKARFSERIENAGFVSVDGLLVLVEHYQKKGDTEKATEVFMKARAAARANPVHDYRGKNLKDMAEKLGEPELMEKPLDESRFRAAGFRDVSELTEPLFVERALDEPVTFFGRNRQGQLETISYLVRESHDPGYGGYKLMQVRKTDSSTGATSYGFGSGQDYSLYLDPWLLTVDAVPLGDGRFEFTVEAENRRADAQDAAQ